MGKIALELQRPKAERVSPREWRLKDEREPMTTGCGPTQYSAQGSKRAVMLKNTLLPFTLPRESRSVLTSPRPLLIEG